MVKHSLYIPGAQIQTQTRSHNFLLDTSTRLSSLWDSSYEMGFPDEFSALRTSHTSLVSAAN